MGFSYVRAQGRIGNVGARPDAGRGATCTRLDFRRVEIVVLSRKYRYHDLTNMFVRAT
jgi:hypothetical protein